MAAPSGPTYQERFASGGHPGVSTDATARAVTGMSIGAIKSWQEMRERVWTEALDEYDQQYQAPVTIECNNVPVWADVRIEFDLVFVLEPSRESDYENPTFTFGMEYASGEPLFFSVLVKEWSKDEQGVNGCVLSVGAFNPASGKMVRFTGIIHLNFQGYGGPVSDETEDDE